MEDDEFIENYMKDPLSSKFTHDLTLLLKSVDDLNRGVEWYDEAARCIMKKSGTLHNWLCAKDLSGESDADLKKICKGFKDPKIIFRLVKSIRDSNIPTSGKVSTPIIDKEGSKNAKNAADHLEIDSDGEFDVDSTIVKTKEQKVIPPNENGVSVYEDLSANFFPSEHSVTKCKKVTKQNGLWQFPSFNIMEIVKELGDVAESQDESESDFLGEITREINKRKLDKDRLPKNLNMLLLAIDDFLTALHMHDLFTAGQIANYRKLILRVGMIYKSTKVAALYDRNIRKLFVSISKRGTPVDWNSMTSTINDICLREALGTVEEEGKKRLKKTETSKPKNSNGPKKNFTRNNNNGNYQAPSYYQSSHRQPYNYQSQWNGYQRGYNNYYDSKKSRSDYNNNTPRALADAPNAKD
jgi:hypothetical protein